MEMPIAPPPGLELPMQINKHMMSVPDPCAPSSQDLFESPNFDLPGFQHRRRRSLTMDATAEDMLRDWAEAEGISRNEIEVPTERSEEEKLDFLLQYYLRTRNNWEELDKFEVWPTPKKIPKTRGNSSRNLTVHFADEKEGQLAEVQYVEAIKTRTHPVAWFWWAAADENEARQWPSCRYWEEHKCWIPADEFPQPTASEETAAAVDNNQTQAPVQTPRAEEGAPCEQRSGKVHGKSRIEAPDSEWCDVVIKKLQSENRKTRDVGFMFLFSNDPDITDSEHPKVGPKDGDVFLPLALSSHGYQVVIQALEVGSCGQYGEQAKILTLLRGNVKELLASPHGCEVLQACVEYAIPSEVLFVVTELQGMACEVARMPEKYQLICRLLEHLPSNLVEPLAEELLVEVQSLCRHPRGNHVIKHLLEYGSPAQQHTICNMIANDLLGLSKHRIASHVVEKAVDASDFDASSLVAQAALNQPGALLELACKRQSQFVAKRLANRPGAEGHAVRCVLCANLDQLTKSKYGERLAEMLATFLGATAGA